MIRVLALLALVAVPINCLSGVRLIYYSGAGAAAVELQTVGVQSLSIDSSKQLKIICHGLAASSTVDWYNPLIQAYLAKGHKVIGIDWGEYANGGYSDAISAAPQVGDVIATYVVQLRSAGVDLANVHISGHSLGAHIAGFAGKKIFALTGSKIGRITGIDPAGPLFTSVAESGRLCPTDASFVDVIHTNAGVAGLNKNIGTADFYPDGGANQNSCGLLALGCSHNIAPVYMIESVTSNNFVARQCGSYNNYKSGSCANNPSAIMGEGCSPSASGVYYLTTNKAAPYGQG